MSEPAREIETVSHQMSLAMPEMDMQTAVARFQQLGQFVSTILKEGVDFGKIPGTPKNTLLKPGAEKLCTFFGLTKEEIILDREMDWTGANHGGEPFFYFHYQIRLFRKGQLIAEADGSANSWESKHRYRQGEYKCPKCGKETIRKSKADKGGGFYCWSKLGGCGVTFKAGDSTIESQDVGKKKNPDPADLVNTIQKMAYKRAFVAATLVAVNASEYFTQDLEDLPEWEPSSPIDPPQEPINQQKSTLEDRKQKAVKWLLSKEQTLGTAENYLKKSFEDWDTKDLDEIKAWGKRGFKPEEDIP